MSNSIYPIKIDLYQDHALVRPASANLAKPVNLKDLLGVFSSSVQDVFNYSRSEIARLPRGTYFTEHAGDRLNISTYHPETPKVVKFYDGSRTKEYEIMFPNVVIHMILQVGNNGADHTLQGSYFYSTPMGVDDLPSAIPGRLRGVFSYVPFPNFYDNFTMCLGHNSIVHAVSNGDLRAFNLLYNILTDSPFNSDLCLHNVKYDYDGYYKNWFKRLAEVFASDGRFPYEEVSF